QRVVKNESPRKFIGRNTGGRREALALAKRNEMIPPGDPVARCIDSGLQVVVSGRTIEVMTHVVFACPKQLDRSADDFGNVRALNHVVVGEASPEASAHAREVDGDVLFADAKRFRNLAPAAMRRLS